MKKIFQGTLFLTTLLVGAQVSADDFENNWSIGAGAYSFSFANDDNSDVNIDFSGFNVAAGYAVNNFFQVRVTYFSLENDDNSALESTGFDLMAYGGIGLAEQGFRGYGGGGVYSDKWSGVGTSESFASLQLGAGLGYNWGPAALDLVVTLRSGEQYEDYVSVSGTYFAMSGNLTVSYLF